MAWSERVPVPCLIAACATALCFSGSALPLWDPLRPFHIGLALVLALACWRDFRETALRGGLSAWIAVFAALVAVQALWVADRGRYATYAAFIAMACAQMLLGFYMARRAPDRLRPLMAAAVAWAIALAFLPAAMRELSVGAWPATPLSAGPWGNVNDMATVLVIANLVWLLAARRLSWPLLAVCWIYCAALDRRAGLLAAMLLALGYILCFAATRRDKLRQVAAWTAALAVTVGTTHIATRLNDVQVRVSRELAGAGPGTVAPAIPGGSVPLAAGQARAGPSGTPREVSPFSPPDERPPHTPSAGAADLIRPAEEDRPRQATEDPGRQGPAIRGESGGHPGGHAPDERGGSPAPRPPNAGAPEAPRAPGQAQQSERDRLREAAREARRSDRKRAQAKARGERLARSAKARALAERSNSVAVRLDLMEQMGRIMLRMPWWQWVAGLGAGQLDLTWRITGRPWASPHFFWWEMFFYLGLAWPAFLGFLFLRSDRRGKLALVVLAASGIASSSLIYLQPLWFFLGVSYARLRDGADTPAPGSGSTPPASRLPT